MKRQINFQVNDKNQLTEKVIEYFTRSGFKFAGVNKDKLAFNHNSSLLDAWTTNPLTWGSEITVTLNDDEVRAIFWVDSDSQMNTAEEERVWNTFIKNFRTFLTSEAHYVDTTEMAIREVTKSRIKYIGWVVLGALGGGIIGIIVSKLTGIESIGIFTIPIFASLF